MRSMVGMVGMVGETVFQAIPGEERSLDPNSHAASLILRDGRYPTSQQIPAHALWPSKNPKKWPAGRGIAEKNRRLAGNALWSAFHQPCGT
jgi:hypothetical protein